MTVRIKTRITDGRRQPPKSRCSDQLFPSLRSVSALIPLARQFRAAFHFRHCFDLICLPQLQTSILPADGASAPLVCGSELSSSDTTASCCAFSSAARERVCVSRRCPRGLAETWHETLGQLCHKLTMKEFASTSKPTSTGIRDLNCLERLTPAGLAPPWTVCTVNTAGEGLCEPPKLRSQHSDFLDLRHIPPDLCGEVVSIGGTWRSVTSSACNAVTASIANEASRQRPASRSANHADWVGVFRSDWPKPPLSLPGMKVRCAARRARST